MLKGIRTASTLLVFAFACSLTAMPQEQGAGQKAETASQDSSPESYFRLDFRVLELSAEGKIVDSHSYSETVAAGPKSVPNSLRTGERVPVSTGGTQWQYMDTGTDIDVRAVAVAGEKLRLHVTASISTLASSHESDGEAASVSVASGNPIVRQTTWNSDVSAPIGKPTVILSSDNSTDRGKIELELTAVPLPQ